VNPQIRKLGIALIGLFVLLFGQLNNLQLRQAKKLRDDPRNTRAIVVDFSRERGRLLASDGTVLADSLPTQDNLKRLRRYTNGPLYASVTGYFSFNYGTDGAERAFNAQLAGKDVRIASLADLLSADPKINDVTLTIVPKLQQVASDALAGRRGAVVALDPRTGAILAMVSAPTFEPNALASHELAEVQKAWTAFQADAAKPLLPRAYRERYPPGSTFKVVTTSAALASAPELITKPYPALKSLDLKGTNKDLPNFGGSTCGGTAPDLLRVSCNTGFGQMGIDLGGPRLRERATAFGFGERPPIDLPAAAASSFPSLDSLKSQPELAFSAIGQLDVAASPLQMALVAAGIGNGGVTMAPHVLAKVTDAKGVVVDEPQPKQWKTPLGIDQAAALRDMMVGVVERGTAKNMAIPGVQVAGKTGTAQTVGTKAHAWIIGFAPAAAPTIAIAVIVESQTDNDGQTGGAVAAPIAKRVLQAHLGK
jgi:peptidoglycan glycosyltransferase